MQEYSITKCSKKCAVSGRTLAPGESYISVVMTAGDGVKRVDIAANEWTQPDKNTVGWWRNRMPEAKAKRVRPAPNGVLLDTLSQLLDCPGKESLAYLLAVLLVRRRVLVEDESFDELEPESETHWLLSCPADGRQWQVPPVDPPPPELPGLQEELNGLLFTEE